MEDEIQILGDIAATRVRSFEGNYAPPPDAGTNRYSDGRERRNHCN